MKKIFFSVVAAVVAGVSFGAELRASAASAAIRVDTRMGLFGGRIANGVEAVGEPDGSDTSVWVTTNAVAGVKDFADGWYARETDEYGLKDWVPLDGEETPDHDVLLLNEPRVVGGRLAADEVWAVTDAVRVVRHNVVVPDGVTLTIDAETPVKFTEEARIVVEAGGALVAKGAWFAEIQDDEWVDGDTNLDGANSAATGTQDWIAGVDSGDYVHVLMLDGAEQVFPTRTYTRGEVYGNLPTHDRYEEGFYFRGWVTNLSDRVGVAADQPVEMDQDALYCNWEAIYLNISTGLVEFAAYAVGEEHTFAVESNDKWIWSCDADWTGNCDWDYLAFMADGQVVRKIEGQTDWQEVRYNFTGNGAHVIQWFYTKNAGFPDWEPGEDCGWVDQVTWTPALFVRAGDDARELYTDASWLMKVGLVGAAADDEAILETAQADDDGDGYTNEEEAILGTNPKDPSSKLEVKLLAEQDGLMRVDYAPENKTSPTHTLDYRVIGVTELGGEWKDVTDLSDAERQAAGFRFFKVKVNVQKK